MKYKFLVMLIFFIGFSFVNLSSGNLKKIAIDPDCYNTCCKSKKVKEPIKEDYSISQLSPLNHFLNFL